MKMIPPHIYTYWEPEPIPLQIQEYIDTWSKVGFQVTILKKSDIEFVGAGAKTLLLKPQMRADWIRLKIISEKGGIWLDASIFINDPKPILELYYHANINNSEIGGFTINSILQTDFRYPVLENWCFMAPPQSPFMIEWKTEFDLALWMGFDEYIQFQKEINMQKIVSMYKSYLTMHVCAQVIIQKRYQQGLNPIQYLKLIKAEETFYKLHTDCHWKLDCIIDSNKEKYDVVKIRRCDREMTPWQRLLRTVFLP
jgi:hypothetical protein